jgi:hypothetical protein
VDGAACHSGVGLGILGDLNLLQTGQHSTAKMPLRRESAVS